MTAGKMSNGTLSPGKRVRQSYPMLVNDAGKGQIASGRIAAWKFCQRIICHLKILPAEYFGQQDFFRALFKFFRAQKYS